MLLFTPDERRAVIFCAAVFLAGTFLQIAFKLYPPAPRHLVLLDEPPARPKVDINHASYNELLAVPGFGPATAARVFNRRRDKGHFTSLEELKTIKGLGKRSWARAAPHLSIGP